MIADAGRTAAEVIDLLFLLVPLAGCLLGLITLCTWSEPRCRYKRCHRGQVGLSAWCREHTNRILDGEDPVTWPRRKP